MFYDTNQLVVGDGVGAFLLAPELVLRDLWEGGRSLFCSCRGVILRSRGDGGSLGGRPGPFFFAGWLD